MCPLDSRAIIIQGVIKSGVLGLLSYETWLLEGARIFTPKFLLRDSPVGGGCMNKARVLRNWGRNQSNLDVKKKVELQERGIRCNVG